MLTTPVLQLNPERVGDIDPRDVSSLFGMWTVFNKCAQSIPDGKRLENLSWRVWARETLCCPPQPEDLIVPAINISPSRSSGVPSLAGSIDTEPDEDSALSKSRGKEPHLNSKVLEKIVINIQEKSSLEPLSPTIEAVVNAKMQASSASIQSQDLDLSGIQPARSTDSSCISSTTATTASVARPGEHRDSETSVSSADGGDVLIRSGSVVKGFSPAPSSFRSSRLAKTLSNPLKKPSGQNLIPSKAGMFTLGGSSEDDESSFEQRMSFKRPTPSQRQSSLSQSLNKPMDTQKKTTSFRDIVEQRRIMEASENDEGAIASDSDEDEDAIESVGSEEDEDDWDDVATDDEKQPKEPAAPVFTRIDSRPNLVSRRSILTQGLTEGDRAKGLLNAASKSTTAIGRGRTPSHNGPSMPGSPDENEGMVMAKPQKTEKPLPIITTTNANNNNNYAMAQSPRATRRAMLSTELTESLRKNMLLERQGKQANLPFIRRQATSMANLQRANAQGQQNGTQQAPPMVTGDPSRTNGQSWTEFETPWEYNTKGW